MICKECGEDKKHCAKGMCRTCYDKIYNKKRHFSNGNYNRKKNSKEIEKRKNSAKTLTGIKRQPLKKQTCELIKHHHNDLKDDPESLSTEFIQKLIGVGCDDDL